ncbi:P-loop containing nucleoside triphosphate hydrolase protein [Suillus clintonianus]|uniref:P-loop containing nucleoside triphosphate hydrolase protein n=1 Tax=Suillus clintonianus TaxID=1904413 RepID=UPI001B87E834|nr:P-loop containing nucleoside triphosphate hydrolase protein [Suillus clintonianus]KAG2151338.1 P-loop containing nucleoside triphosphate hydrolase protein [Suillus clintonianus]
MAKRKVTVDSDEETLGASSQHSKRARTVDSEEEVVVDRSQHRKRKPTNGNGKARQEDSDEDDEDDDEDPTQEEHNEEEEQRFEELNGEAIRQRLEQKRNTFGGIAEHGIIESIEMHHFMCHKRLTFTFGPQINFIIGHNGSGKSAVLSAITIALGGKANSTGRGSGLKSFIREGQQISEITISLKNQGEEAYKPKEYGKSIVITRKFTKDGSSSWKIKSKDGKVVSTKRDELSAICDHMNIQVDNPMNVLSQDAARQFLSASHPSDKYKFFLRGTQLSQLSEEYDACLDNINQTKKVLHQKKQVLPDLRATFKEASVRFEEASKAREQRCKVDELKKELAWAHVAAKQAEMEAKLGEVAKAERRLPKIEAEMKTAESQFQLASDAVVEFDKEYSALGDIDHLTKQRDDYQEKMRANRVKIGNFKNDEKQMNTSLTSLNDAIENYTRNIAEEERRLAADTQVKRDELNRKLQSARTDVTNADQAHKDFLEAQRQKLAQQEGIKTKGQAAEAKKNSAQERVAAVQSMISQCKEKGQNALAPYGRDIKAVLDQIAKMRWHGDVPVGPLGIHVKLKDMAWADLMRIQLGGLMSAFAVTDARDRPQLKRLLDQTKNQHINIIISERDMFDFSAGEPPNHILTVLRVLEITDPYVLRLLINQANIERTVVAPKRLDADNILKRMSGGGVAWAADYMRVHRYADGGGQSIKLHRLSPGDPRNMMFTPSDSASVLNTWQENLRNAEDEYQAAQVETAKLRQEYQSLAREIDGMKEQGRSLFEAHRAAKQELASLQEEAKEEMPADIMGLQSAKEEAEAEKASIMQQFEDAVSRRTTIDQEQAILLTESNKVKAQIQNFEEARQGIQKKIEDAAASRVEAQSNKGHYIKKLEDERKKVEAIDAIAKQLQEEFINWTTGAEEYCERVENPRKVDAVERTLESVQKALKERERRHGATVEEMTIEVNNAKSVLDNAERDLRSLASLNNALKRSLVIRLTRWQEFRRHIALRCKVVFQYHLSNRGYYGKILFDHANQTLQLKVQTDDQMATQGRDKDPRSLSGGEKSFSTICLLLSLWDAIGCPLRCLDEFDVFMDAVNRRISMKMMIDTANASDKKQYILITPQDMGNIHVGQTVRVHRMSDPERGQGILAFT